MEGIVSRVERGRKEITVRFGSRTTETFQLLDTGAGPAPGMSLAAIGSFRHHHRLHRRVGAADRSHLPEKDVSTTALAAPSSETSQRAGYRAETGCSYVTRSLRYLMNGLQPFFALAMRSIELRGVRWADGTVASSAGRGV